MSSRIESRVSEESSGLKWDMGLTLEEAEVLHFLIVWVSYEWFCVPCNTLHFHNCLFHFGQRKGGKT